MHYVFCLLVPFVKKSGMGILEYQFLPLCTRATRKRTEVGASKYRARRIIRCNILIGAAFVASLGRPK